MQSTIVRGQAQNNKRINIPSCFFRVTVIGWGLTGSRKEGEDPRPGQDHLERFGVGYRTLQKLLVPLVKNFVLLKLAKHLTDKFGEKMIAKLSVETLHYKGLHFKS